MTYKTKEEVEKEFDKEVVDYFWNKENTVGTQRLSINHIEKIKSFQNSLRLQDLEAIEEIVKGKFDELPNEGSWGENERGRYQALDELLSHLQELKKKI